MTFKIYVGKVDSVLYAVCHLLVSRFVPDELRCFKCFYMCLEQCERSEDHLCLGTSVSFLLSSANLCYPKNMSIPYKFQIDFHHKSRINKGTIFLFD
jgi:hypothetical protein